MTVPLLLSMTSARLTGLASVRLALLVAEIRPALLSIRVPAVSVMASPRIAPWRLLMSAALTLTVAPSMPWFWPWVLSLRTVPACTLTVPSERIRPALLSTLPLPTCRSTPCLACSEPPRLLTALPSTVSLPLAPITPASLSRPVVLRLMSPLDETLPRLTSAPAVTLSGPCATMPRALPELALRTVLLPASRLNASPACSRPPSLPRSPLRMSSLPCATMLPLPLASAPLAMRTSRCAAMLPWRLSRDWFWLSMRMSLALSLPL